MHIDLARWLIAEQPRLLSCWAVALQAVAKRRASADEDTTTDASANDVPLDEARMYVLKQIHEDVIRAARGEFTELNTRLCGISQLDGWQEVGLSDLLQVLFQFRQQAWAILQQDGVDYPC